MAKQRLAKPDTLQDPPAQRRMGDERTCRKTEPDEVFIENVHLMQTSCLSQSKSGKTLVEWVVPMSQDVVVVELMIRELCGAVCPEVYGKLAQNGFAGQVSRPQHCWMIFSTST